MEEGFLWPSLKCTCFGILFGSTGCHGHLFGCSQVPDIYFQVPVSSFEDGELGHFTTWVWW